jgi:membrane associated rhomboid family serine protease
MKRSWKVALQIFGLVALFAGWFFVAPRYEGALEPQAPVPAPVCAKIPPASTSQLAAALLAGADQRVLLRDDEGAAVLVLDAVVILLPESEQRPPAEALAAALAPLTPEVRAGLGDRTALVVWLGRGHARKADPAELPAWDPQLRLDLFHDQITDYDCLVRAGATPDPGHPLSRRKYNRSAEKVAQAEKLLAAAIDRSPLTPLAGEELTARLARDRQRMHSSGIWSQRQRSLPPSAIVLTVLLFIFFWRAATDGDTDIAELDTSALARDGALLVPVPPGQGYRVLSHGLLHAGLQHLLNNCISLYIGCYLLEPALGAARTLLLFLAGVAGGGVARILIRRKGLLVGASGGAFALNGASLALVLLPGPWVPFLDRQGVLLLMAIMLGAGLFLSLLPNISLVGHLGGALAGGLLVLTGLITLGRPTLDGGVESPASVAIAWSLAIIGVTAWVFSGIWVRHLSQK